MSHLSVNRAMKFDGSLAFISFFVVTKSNGAFQEAVRGERTVDSHGFFIFKKADRWRAKRNSRYLKALKHLPLRKTILFRVGGGCAK